jgi:electron transfer flavoprotein alpha subunit
MNTSNTSNTSGAVWVAAEVDDCRLRSVSLQLVGKARLLADRLDVAVEALLVGNQLKEPARELIAAGADRVYTAESPGLALYQSEAYADVIVNLAQARQPQILLMGSTFMGRELAPMVAARLDTGLTAHCIDLVLDENKVLDQRIPAYGGLLSILCPERRPQMATVAGGVFPTPSPDDSREGEIESVAVPAEPAKRVRTLEVVNESDGNVSLDAAACIVTGGAGAGSLDGWQQIKHLSDTLGAALGCTRPAVDEGWAELETMIGQSGKMVSPQFYIGVGLSGELQHMVGIKGAQLMVAINNDPKSPVFEQVDVGIVEDCRTFLPLLIEKINVYREQQVTCRPVGRDA